MFRIGLNPYGLTYTVGLQGAGTPRANPQPIGIAGFIAIARDLGVRHVELDHRWLTPMRDSELAALGGQLAEFGLTPTCSFWLAQQPGETLADGIRCACALRAPVLRLHLTPVIEGARAAWGEQWPAMTTHARAILARDAPKAADAGVTLAIENHQDLGSEELVAIAEEAGDNVGVVLDTGNPFAVGEDPVAFTRRAAHRIRHVHLKDYVAQFTGEGYRLIRCAIGDGSVPLQEIARELAQEVTASIEPGALEARHIRAFAPDWWTGYPPREAGEFATAIGRLRQRRLEEDADCRTPWERDAAGPDLVAYEMDQIRRSALYLRTIGWL
ncbi:MAG: sugar phosphate isomerase/epimerase family protein [Acidobacteriota bacterium]